MANKTNHPLPEGDPFWYKDAVIYEVHVRAFCDSDGDGIGDFKGLAEKLDYLRDLGVTAVWLLPFYPSPLRDDGYDISDSTSVNPTFGDLADFKHFLREAHRRGLRVITELVLNHTSDQHPWFQRARHAPPGSSHRNFYVWSDTPERYRDARIIFKDFESSNWTWDPVAKSYYWHRFYSHQPDLNFENPQVRKAVYQAMDFWLEMGVDGLRLDAVPYLFEREGTNCENLPETHRELKLLRKHVDENFRGRMLLAEANQWPEEAVHYFGEGDECHMAFHFPFMPRMFMAVRMEDRYPIIDILSQTPPIPETCQWALFLRNHDELTLEMVTDEERDYMYRMYAHDPQARINLGIRRRLAPLLGNSRRRIELMNGLLFSLPGTPVIYYGDEIGMGDNIYLGDRNGVRTPMQWNADRNAGFSRANSQRLYLPVIIDPDFHYEAVNVEAQQNNRYSLLWWMRRLIALRRRHHAFSRGTLEFLYPENRKVLAFIRCHKDECLLVVANLSRFMQYARLDLSSRKGSVPVELFGQTEFPAIEDQPYLLTLAPHSFCWFSLKPRRVETVEAVPRAVPEAVPAGFPVLAVEGRWDSILRNDSKQALEAIFPDYLKTRRWFGGKTRAMTGVEIIETVPIASDSSTAHVAFVRVGYAEGDPEVYAIPLTFAAGDRAAQVLESMPHLVLARLKARGGDGVLYDALGEKWFAEALLGAMARRRRFRGIQGEIEGSHTRAFRRLWGGREADLEPQILRDEQTNSALLFGDRLFLKFFRKAEEGVNPDIEIGTFLTDTVSFPNIPPVAGSIQYRRGRGEPVSLGILLGYVSNEGDAWQFMQDRVGSYCERVASRLPELREFSLPSENLIDLTEGGITPFAHELVGISLEAARLIGVRTAELHLALASRSEDPVFAPEPFNPFYQRSLFQSLRNLAEESLKLLQSSLASLPAEVQEPARKVLAAQGEILGRFRTILVKKISGLRIRIHGDYHLGQVLWTGRDFVIIDFEGEPARSLPARRLKRNPLRDVSSMVRSFHYAAYSGLDEQVSKGVVKAEDLAAVEHWAHYWYLWVSSSFLKAYFEHAPGAPFLPKDRGEIRELLPIYLLEKAIYELAYELRKRPGWVRLPLKGILHILETSPAAR